MKSNKSGGQNGFDSFLNNVFSGVKEKKESKKLVRTDRKLSGENTDTNIVKKGDQDLMALLTQGTSQATTKERPKRDDERVKGIGLGFEQLG